MQQDEILPMFLNKDEDSEIRIAAYKTLMECPNEGLINIIKRTLEKEEVNQVITEDTVIFAVAVLFC